MTPEQHEKEKIALAWAIACKKHVLRSGVTRQSKADLRAQIHDLEQRLRQHKLNYPVLTSPKE